jgi:ubiquinone/menaquinone biosynthesis C-methylase UbiE
MCLNIYPTITDALKEISRVLRPGGLAILPVPVITDVTIEFGEPKADEEDHWRRVGHDYYERYEKIFGKVIMYRSDEFPDNFHAFVHNKETNGRIEEEVPVCIKKD